MKHKKLVGYISLAFLVLVSGWLNAQNAPVTRINDTVACPGAEITIPVRVTDFNSIGSLSLKLQFNAAALTFQSWSNTGGFPGLMLNNPSSGMLIISGFNNITGGFSLPDHSMFFTVTFIYLGGSGTLTWFDNGNSCEYTGPTPTYTVLNDNPTNKYYINGTVAPSLVPDFTSSTQLPVLNDTVSFTDLSSGSPTGWNWTVSPGSYLFVNGTNGNSQNPEIKFTGNGPFTVSLTVNTSTCSSSVTRPDWIHVGIPGMWTGQFSSDWHNPLNWQNGLIPDATTDVVVPPSATNWPEFSGDFTLGIQCLNLTIQGTSGQLTVTGDFILP